jgi:pyridoxal phosphate phosphatase PHOSPHO2
MEDLFRKIDGARKNESASQFIIVSDANDFFIKTILSQIEPAIPPNAIFTNSTIETKVFDGNTKHRFTYLQVVPFDNQRDCDICPPNLCKGKVLRNYLKKHGPFQNVYYVGDGHNDFCPALELTGDDTLFVRRGFRLEKLLAKPCVGKHSTVLKCSIVFWNDANDIAPFMQF